MPRLVAVCVVHQLRPDPGNGVTAIDKRPVDGRVRVGRYGVRADVQADRKHHGGLDKALYAYAEEDAAFWADELGRDLPPGFFGENLRTEGIDVNDARIGEVWRIGDTVTAEVTMPRTPCQTFARWVGGADQRGWVKRFSAERRLGPYLRVLRNGFVQAGDPIEVISRPDGAPGLLDRYRDPA
ncbi:MOSC domain-containing protein [Microbacterium sp. zg.B48]|uniref:MOSC domain-containing protein n=1 Tax=Microbacterium sp. zg.B48 TaxID=2969408 RepID=UPI00214B5330|nr:MOSC domain-containing protein [Microbacterium sp. zg.B48]MCR2762274.1 MOSC domain-containing protein [Microbacterium sp. zg.B48]